ncbi:MAG: hypothetical protein K9L70_12020, partial [Thiohalocapsa sp.]|nr:hypothetical protein [Thiohalocapsa sp.]
MTDTTLLFALAFAGGLAVGWVYFYGLYRTVRALPRAGRPALLLGASLLLRAGILIGGAWLLLRAGAGAGHLLAALAGVLAMRVLLVGRFGNLRGGAPSPTRAAARDNDP